MSKITLIPEEEHWLKNLFFYLLDSAKPSSLNWSADDFNAAAKQCMWAENGDTAWSAVQKLMDEIENRSYKDVDAEIKYLANNTTFMHNGHSIIADTHDIALALAKMCYLNDISWDPANYTDYEVRYFNKSLLGKAIKEVIDKANEPDVTSQPAQSTVATASTPASNANNSAASTTNTHSTTNATNSTSVSTSSPSPSMSGKAPTTGKPPRVGTVDTVDNNGHTVAGNYIKPDSVHSRSVKKKNNVPGNDYKSSGPRSADAYDLQSTPGQKIKVKPSQVTLLDKRGNPKTIDGIWCVIAKESTTSANTPYAFVNPLIDTPTYRANGTNRVKFGSAHGYSDLILYFQSKQEAADFAQKIINAKLVPAKLQIVTVGVQDLSLKAFNSDFYMIGTELGPALVCAYKLNEDYDPDIAAEMENGVLTEPLVATEPTKEKTEEEYKAAVRQLSRARMFD